MTGETTSSAFLTPISPSPDRPKAAKKRETQHRFYDDEVGFELKAADP
jgi:hypothetical protein